MGTRQNAGGLVLKSYIRQAFLEFPISCVNYAGIAVFASRVHCRCVFPAAPAMAEKSNEDPGSRAPNSSLSAPLTFPPWRPERRKRTERVPADVKDPAQREAMLRINGLSLEPARPSWKKQLEFQIAELQEQDVSGPSQP